MNKYKNSETTVNNIRFASKKEAMRYLELKSLQQTGVISELELQVPFQLCNKKGYKVKYIADFAYVKNGERIIEDVKGVRTPVYRVKKAWLFDKFGIDINEI